MTAAFDAPTTEPPRLTAGDRWAWSRPDLLAEFGAGVVLSYAATPEGGGAVEVVTADAAFAVLVAPAASAAFAPGAWLFAPILTRTADGARETRPALRIEVMPDPATTEGDRRSAARRILAEIDARLEGRALKDVESYTIEGRTLARTPVADLLRLRALYQRAVAAEDAAASGVAGGLRNVPVRFR